MTQIDDLNVLQPEEHPGGTFRNVRIFADTTITGPIHCETLSIYEPASFQQTVTAKKLIISKDATFYGPVTALEIEVEGTGVFRDHVKCNRLDVKNQITAEGKVEAYEGMIQGMAAFQDYDGFQLSVSGLIRCKGLLRCNHITFLESGRGTLNEVFGAIVKIQSKNFLQDGKPTVYMSQLVAYDVDLNHTSIERLETKRLKKDDHSIVHHLRIIGEHE